MSLFLDLNKKFKGLRSTKNDKSTTIAMVISDDDDDLDDYQDDDEMTIPENAYSMFPPSTAALLSDLEETVPLSPLLSQASMASLTPDIVLSEAIPVPITTLIPLSLPMNESAVLESLPVLTINGPVVSSAPPGPPSVLSDLATTVMWPEGVPQLYLIGLDIEASGQRLSKHAMVGLGAAVIRVSDRKKVAEFSSEMNIPKDLGWEQRCLDEFWDNKKTDGFEELQAYKKRINNNACEEPAVAMKRFVSWLRNDVLKDIAKGDYQVLDFVSDTTSFDLTWINYYLDKYTDEGPLHLFWDNHFRDVIQANSYAQALARLNPLHCYVIDQIDGWCSKTKEARKMLRIPDDIKPDAPHDHKAVHDAQNIAEELLIQMNFM